MELKDLKTGMRIILRNGEEYIVLKDVITPYQEGIEDIYILIDGGWMSSSSYNNDLRCKNNKNYDIMKVYVQNHEEYIDGHVLQRDAIKSMDLIWERKEKRKMTVSEICEELGYDIEIVKED